MLNRKMEDSVQGRSDGKSWAEDIWGGWRKATKAELERWKRKELRRLRRLAIKKAQATGNDGSDDCESGAESGTEFNGGEEEDDSSLTKNEDEDDSGQDLGTGDGKAVGFGNLDNAGDEPAEMKKGEPSVYTSDLRDIPMPRPPSAEFWKRKTGANAKAKKQSQLPFFLWIP